MVDFVIFKEFENLSEEKRTLHSFCNYLEEFIYCNNYNIYQFVTIIIYSNLFNLKFIRKDIRSLT